VIDLADIAAGATATVGYSGNNSPGTLTVSDGTHTANIALLGNYLASSFVASSDGHGGTLITGASVLTEQLGNQTLTLTSNQTGH
jgi:large repetitive protein